MNRTSSWTAAFVLGITMLSAQEVPQFPVSGKVVDRETRAGLPNVNVYLANTMIGTTTDLRGDFQIKAVPAGTYELVISLVGYERQIISLRLFQPFREPLEIQMREKPFETTPVEVTARDQSEWRKQLRFFTDFVFGRTNNGMDCTIVNPEVLDFRQGDGSGGFHASAREPLRIENKALGYKIELILQVFSIESNVFKYGGVTRFEEMKEADGKEAEAWERNRVQSYRGSLQHFLRSLLRGDLDREGFVVLSARELPFLRARASFREPANIGEVIRPGEFMFERLLRIHDFLEVRYVREQPEPGFREFWTATAAWNRYENDSQQISWLSMDAPFLRITTDGRLFDPYALKTFGYWSFERLGEWLPLEYLPLE